MRFQTVISALVLLAAASTVAHAQTYNATTDFIFGSNTATQTWQYGYAADLGGTFTLFNTAVGSANNPRGWNTPGIAGDGTPVIYRNDSTGSVNGTLPGQVAMHPGPAGTIGDFSVLRFLVPATASYTINAQWFIGDTGGGGSGNTDAYILLNALAGSPVYSIASTTSNPTFNGTRNLTAGDTLDFIVGTGGDGYSFDTTPVNISLTQNAVAVPEAGTLALLAPVLLGGTVAIARRRRHE